MNTVSTSTKSGFNATVKREDSKVERRYIVDWGNKYRVTKKYGKKQEYFGVYNTIEEARKYRDIALDMMENNYSIEEIRDRLGIGGSKRHTRSYISGIKSNGAFNIDDFINFYELTKGSRTFTKEQKTIIDDVVSKKIELEKLKQKINVISDDINKTPNDIVAVMEDVYNKDKMASMEKKIKQLEKTNKELENKITPKESN